MWPRVVEFMLACWLAMSPFIFQHDPEARLLWFSDWATAGFVATAALLSHWRPMRWAHWLILLAGFWLIAFGRLSAESPPPAGLQNNILVGLLLTMFAILPTDALRPPRGWILSTNRHRQNCGQ